jgi:hypothetical protein
MTARLPRLPRLPRHPPTPRELGELAQLLFEWPIRRAPRLALPFCIVVAGLIQAVVVVLFSIRYGAPEEKAPCPPRFYFLPPDSPVAQRIAPWLEAHDPSVFSPLRATEMAVPAPPPLRYRPSYEDPPPPLRPLPELEEAPSGPPDLPLAGEEQRPAAAALAPVTAVAPPTAPALTDVRWMDGLANLLQSGEEATARPPVPRSGAIPRPSGYQVAVGPEGIPLSCVLTDPSGNPEADEAGRAWILSRRFHPAEGVSWGRTLIVWSGAPANPSPTPARP